MPKCDICKEKFTYRNNSFEKTCANKECMSEFALKFLAKKREADAKKIRTDWNKQKREKLDELKTKSDYEKDLQTEINQIVKYLDASWPCISSGKTTGKRNSGHLWSVGSCPSVRFHLMNVYNQSEYDNGYRGGNPLGYRDGIIKTFGLSHMEYVETLKNHPALHLTIEEIKQAIKIARSIVKELKSADKTYTTEERLELRRVYNSQIGLYHI